MKNHYMGPMNTMYIYSTIAYQAIRERECGRYFIESISTFIKYLNSHAKTRVKMK